MTRCSNCRTENEAGRKFCKECGTPLAVLLPAHWQTATVLLAAWWCGAEVVTEPQAADWVLCDSGRVDLAMAAAPAGGVVALSLDAFGRGIPGLPAGVVDFAPEGVRCKIRCRPNVLQGVASPEFMDA